MSDSDPRSFAYPLARVGVSLAASSNLAEVHAQLDRAATALAPDGATVRFALRMADEATPIPDLELVAEVAGEVADVQWHVRAHADEATASNDRARELLETLAQQAAIGLDRIAIRSDRARHERQQSDLVDAGLALSSERTLDGVLQQIVEHAMQLTGARYGALGVLEDGGTELANFVTVGISDEQRELIGELPHGRGILGVLIDDPRPLRLARLQDDPRSVGFPDGHPPMSTFLGVPIITKGTVAGRIYLTEKAGGGAFTDDDERVARALAAQAAIAIDNASLNERLQQTAAALADASRHKSAFLANMSHELRSPLNTIIGYTRLLLEDPRALDEEQLEDLAIVRGSGEHLLALITDLLDLQRIEAGRVSLVLGDERLEPLLENVTASVQPSVPDGVRVELDTSALGSGELHCDATRIRQVLLNVVGNALKFTTSGFVRVTASDLPFAQAVRIEVRDSGPGIPKADQARIFESFYQSTGALDRTPGPREGAGLGLAITKLLVELHGGSVALESVEGEGTTVTIELPRSGPDTTEGVG